MGDGSCTTGSRMDDVDKKIRRDWAFLGRYRIVVVRGSVGKGGSPKGRVWLDIKCF